MIPIRTNILKPIYPVYSVKYSISAQNVTHVTKDCIAQFQEAFNFSSLMRQEGLSNEISSVQSAVTIHDLISSGKITIWDDDRNDKNMPPFPFPFGIWYRGHVKDSYGMVPSALRIQKNKTLDESSLTRVFQNTFPEQLVHHKATFDWLTTMQHYSCPTRLLDWSESLLIGLFFAVNLPQDDEHDGVLWIINARRLNRLASLFSKPIGIATSESFNVTVRAEMSLCNNYHELFQRLKIIRRTDNYDDPSIDELKRFESYLTSSNSYYDEYFEKERIKLNSPIAVLPRRLSIRMKTQSSVFTLCGGKFDYNENVGKDEDFKKLGELIDDLSIIRQSKGVMDLITMNKIEVIKSQTSVNFSNNSVNKPMPFLLPIVIPSSQKKRIRKQLIHIGIHEGSMFTEMDNQSRFLSNYWMYPQD